MLIPMLGVTSPDLLDSSGQVLPREQLLSRVWGYDYEPGSNIVETYIRYLRRNLALTVSRPSAARATDFGPKNCTTSDSSTDSLFRRQY